MSDRLFTESDFEIVSNPLNNVSSHTLEFIGQRKEMEDTTCSLASIPQIGLEHFSFYAVFDGHSSVFASKYLAKEMLNSILLADQSLFNELANKTLRLSENQLAIERMKKAMRKGFLDIDYKMRDLPELEALMKKLESNEIENLETTSSGSTAVVCLITPEYFFIANCGDSRAILVSDNKISLETKDHKPNDAIEKAHIEKAGGEVFEHKSGKFYVDSKLTQNALNLSRSLGDYGFKRNKLKGQTEQIISPEPDVYVRERSEKDEFLVLATDGIWDNISTEEMKNKIQNLSEKPLDKLNTNIQLLSISGVRTVKI